jgi:hypothetical protein
VNEPRGLGNILTHVWRGDPIYNEPLKEKSTMDRSKPASTPTDETSREKPPPIFNPEDLIGRYFLMDEQENSQNFRGCIVELIEDHESKV